MTTPDMSALRNEICARMGVNPDLVPVPRLCSSVTVHNTHAAPAATPLQGDMAAQVAHLMGVTLPQHQAQQVSPLAGQIQALTAQVQGLVQQHQQHAAAPHNDQDAQRAEVFRLMGCLPTQRTGA